MNGAGFNRACAIISSEDVIDRLLQNKHCEINIQDDSGETAIFYAIKNGYLEIVDKLIVNGSNIWHIDKYGETLLHYATTSDNPKVLERVLSLGLDVNYRGNNGWTPLMEAALYNCKEAIKILLEHGADTTIRNSVGFIAVDYVENDDDDDIRNLFIY